MVNRTTFEKINIDDFNHDPINQEKVQSYPPELVGRFNSFIVTAFDDSMTVEMQIRTLIKWIKENIDVTTSALDNMEAFKQDSMAFQNHVKNTLVNLINQFIDKFDDNLKAETLEILNQWLMDGVLSDLVRVAINEEVINARGDEDSLGERLDKSDNHLLNISNEISNARGGKDTLSKRLDETDTQLAQISLNLKTFGAVGDGITNDTSKFVEAINLLSQKGGGTLAIPTGDYLIDPDVIQLKSNVNIIGTGKSRILTKHGEPYEFMLGNHTETVKNVEISGLEFDQFHEIGLFEPITNTLPTRMISIYEPIDVHINKNHFNNLFGQHAILSGYWINSDGNYIKDNRVTCNRFLPNTTEMYDASAIYVDDQYHEISNNIIESIDTGYHWWKVPGAIEVHGTMGFVKDNVITGAYIGLNLCGDPQLNRTNNHHYVISGNKFDRVHKGISIWTDKTLRDIENVHIFQNTINIDITFTAKGNNAIGFEPYTARGNLRNVVISDNIINGQKSYDNYTGTNLLSTAEDFSAFNLNKLDGTVEDVKIHNNIITNYGGGILSTARNTNSPNKVKNVHFKDNHIVDPLRFPFTGTYFGLYDIADGEEITITNNKLIFTNDAELPANTPEVYLLNIGDNVKNLTYLNNQQIEGNVAIGRVNVSDINKSDLQIDVGLYKRGSGGRVTNVLTTNEPTKGTYYIDDVLNYVGVPYNNGYRGKICSTKGTIGSKISIATKQYSYQFSSDATYRLEDIINFNDTTVTITGKNGNSYYVDNILPSGSEILINYQTPVFVDLEKS